jgi:plastocyanin
MRKSFAAVAAAALALAVSSAAFAEIKGKVTLDGKAPEMKEIDMSAVKECAAQHADPVTEQTVVADDKGNLANVIVAIKKAEGQELAGEAPSEPAVLDQKGCMYEPHVVAMMAGQEMVIKNDDPFLHNVHALSTVNPPFNFGQPTKDQEGKKLGADAPKAEEYFRVKCDVHPWMSAYIGVFEHPFFAVTKEDGTFEIDTKGLADGEYTLTFWHEKFASETPAEAKVTVKDGKAEANHQFKAEAAAADPAGPGADVILASRLETAKPANAAEQCEGEKACCKTGTPTLQKVATKVADATK